MISTTAVLLIIAGSAIAAVAAYCLKKGANTYVWYLLWQSWYVLFGLVLYVLSAVLYILALPGTPLSVAFPVSAFVYLFSTALAVGVLKEKMNRWKWMGLVGIIIGVALVGIGS